jgi:uncharacterized integral membrane protein
MNTRLLLRLGVVLAILLFMVLMGMSNNDEITFRLLGAKWGDVPGAIVFFVFFASGVFVGALLTITFRGGR